MGQSLERESYVRRLLAVGAVTVTILAALALAGGRDLPRVSAASSASSSVLVLLPPSNIQQGCALGPAFTFCDQAPATTGAAVQFNVESTAAVSGVSAAMAAIPGLSGNFASGDFTITADTCTGNLAANQQCQISVSFSPTTAGLRQAQISVTDSAGDALAFNVEGTGSQLTLTPPAPASCTPAVLPDNAYTFCTQPINPATPTTETFTLASAGGASNVIVALAAIPGLESEFASGDFIITTPVCPGTIPAGGSCSIGIAFTPTVAGLRSAALTATDSAGDRTTIYLAGSATSGLSFSGAAPSTTQPCAAINQFGFCSLPVGGVSATTTLNLMNSSGTQITGLLVPSGSVIAQGATAPDFTVQSSSCSSVLNSGASCSISVAFTPVASGLRQGAIVVTDAQGDATALNLAGVGDDYSISTQLPTEVSVIPGGTATLNATLTPDSVFGMNGEQVTFTCPTNLPTNTSCAVTPCPASIMPGSPVNVQMVLVTSSTITVAPLPTAGCSSYGPSQTAFVGAPPPGRLDPPPAAHASGNRSSPLDPALLVFAAFGAVGLLIAAIATPEGALLRKRVPLLLASAGLAAALLSGCHHHSAANTSATPIGSTILTFQASALDAGGNSLNAARSFQATLDVVTK